MQLYTSWYSPYNIACMLYTTSGKLTCLLRRQRWLPASFCRCHILLYCERWCRSICQHVFMTISEHAEEEHACLNSGHGGGGPFLRWGCRRTRDRRLTRPRHPPLVLRAEWASHSTLPEPGKCNAALHSSRAVEPSARSCNAETEPARFVDSAAAIKAQQPRVAKINHSDMSASQTGAPKESGNATAQLYCS